MIVERFTLSNGFKVLGIEDPGRHAAALQFWTMVGSADETDAERGISHLIEHMAFKGTTDRGGNKLFQELEKLGGAINAFTRWDHTFFHLTVPSDKVPAGLEVLADAVFNPLLDPGDLEREKRVVLEEILEGHERPSVKAGLLTCETAYTVSPYRFPVVGYPETVQGFTRDSILAFRGKWYVPENMFLVLVGNVEFDRLLPEIDRMVGQIPRGGAVVRPHRPVEPQQTEIRSACVRDRNARETWLSLAFHVPPMRSDDVNALDLAADLLGAREGSRLIQVLKNEKRLVHSISAHCITPRDPGLFGIRATLDAKNVEAATRAVLDELERMAEAPPNVAELDLSRVHIESNHLYLRETVEGYAKIIGALEAEMGDGTYGEKYLRLNRLVTGEEVSSAVQRYLRQPNMTITALVPESHAPLFDMGRVCTTAGTYPPVKPRASRSRRVSDTIATCL
ncbi:MAG: pitrilysin family protein, partial [Pseudomonadota bacterium]